MFLKKDGCFTELLIYIKKGGNHSSRLPPYIDQNLPKIKQKTPQVVKHVVKGEKWACSTLEAGKNKPVMFITKTRDFKRFCEEIKEKSGILRLPIFGRIVHT